MNNNVTNIHITERKCPICGKNFIAAPYHQWKIGYYKRPKLVCSYSCMRKWEKEKLKGGSDNDL